MGVTQVVLLIVFGALSLLNLVAVGLKMRKVQYLSTPLRVPVLAAFYILASASPSWLIIAALALAFIGDLLWLWQKKAHCGCAWWLKANQAMAGSRAAQTRPSPW